MGDLWRSEEMSLVQLFIQNEAAHDTVDELGNLGLIQFKDLNADKSAFQRNFANDVKRCDEIERKLRFMAEQIEKAGIDPERVPRKPKRMTAADLDTVMFDEFEKELKQMNENKEMLDRNYNELVEMKYVLEKGVQFFEQASAMARAAPQGDLLDQDVEERLPLRRREEERAATRTTRALGFIAGVIVRDKRASFERVMFRATRGNMFVRFSEIDEPITDPHTGDKVNKNVFIVFYSGERAQAKINKICEAFAANRYPYPEDKSEQASMMNQVRSRLADLETVIERTSTHRTAVLMNMAANLQAWTTTVKKEKAVFHSLNLFNYDVTRKCLIAEGWTPKASIDKIQLALRKATERSGAQVPSIVNVLNTHETPPTYFRVNKFTKGFQAIVDSYGIARYRELNPAVLSMVTFPFLFAVMFGDLGHSVLMLLFALWLISNEKKWAGKQINEIISMCFGGRYVILLMSIFAMYTGLIYNDTFSLPLKIFNSSYKFPEHPKPGQNVLIAERIGKNTYPFGIDYAWWGCMNKLPFVNSYKMKLSVIFGITQMVTGIIFKYFNDKFFRLRKNILYEFIPQMIFMNCLFGYMVLMIVVKWCTDWFGTLRQPPDLIHTMISMFLTIGTVNEPLFESGETGPGQALLQVVLVLAAVVAIPWMLLPKPLLIKKEYEKAVKLGLIQPGGGHGDGHGHGEFNFGEIMIHQMIHTIEFVLGAISNTASYLRLWALSLAHAELSEVFWERVLGFGFGAAGDGGSMGPIFIWVAFAVWAGATMMVLCVMESLSAFLHALRLHWVEFMNKFYMGDGYKFTPFDYKVVLSSSGEDD
eukprot:tig00000093_g3574.t1